MFDGLLDLLDRDKSRQSSRARPPSGLRGLVARLSGEHEDDDHDRRSHRAGRDHDDLDDGREELLSDHPSRRRRERADWFED